MWLLLQLLLRLVPFRIFVYPLDVSDQVRPAFGLEITVWTLVRLGQVDFSARKKPMVLFKAHLAYIST